ncbi:MAG: hypothetical protein EBU08_22975 [Micrococcales bacterium]|nr:hypothetical protein [Micrococcales bacterium]
MQNDNTLLDAPTFGALVDNMMKTKNLSHIDAILEICRVRELDVEAIPDLLTPKLKKRISDEATSINMMRKKKPKIVG